MSIKQLIDVKKKICTLRLLQQQGLLKAYDGYIDHI